MNKHYRQALLLAGILVSGTAAAATKTTTINVSASVPASCTVSADPIVFGEIVNSGSGQVDTTGDVTVNCSVGIPYNIGMDAGQNYDGTFRAMSNGSGHLIRYIIEKPGLVQWGDSGLSGPVTFPTLGESGSGIGADETFPFFAKANGSGMGTGTNTYTAGTSYSDVVTVTVEF